MNAYSIGELLGALIGMVFLGVGSGWIIRRIRPSTDYGIALGIAIVTLAFAAGFTNSHDYRPYPMTVLMYLAVGIPAFFIAMRAHKAYLVKTGNADQRSIETGLYHSVAAALDPSPKSSIPSAPKITGIAWGRGFFRIWVVLSASWVVCGALIGWNALQNGYVSPMAVATVSDKAAASLYEMYGEPYNSWVAGVTAGQVKATPVRTRFMLYTAADLPAADLQVRMFEAQHIVDTYVRDQLASQRAAALPGIIGGTLIPPIVVLVLGWLVG